MRTLLYTAFRSLRGLVLGLALALVPASATPEGVALRYNGRIEWYRVLYLSADAKFVKVRSVTSGIDFYMLTRTFNELRLSPVQTRVIRNGRT
jgi:hypothetical protein